ncbi:type II CAAX prenyl endopeptidase Rce1 family protein [Spirosoma sp. 209]|uniref:CPBP family glutamic-type intramembrane protease n=1 Tax=Spirosoma sp. 209 TaxID=1955701 RepID=UPI0035169D36
MNRATLIILTTILTNCISFIFSLIIAPIFNDTATGYQTGDSIKLIIIVIIITPIAETILFFSLIRVILQKIDSSGKYFIILSSILFGISHNYSIIYIIDTFITGAIWAYVYLISEKRLENPTVNLIIIHILCNCIMTSLSLI